jgi:outer membrane immunogenic protein
MKKLFTAAAVALALATGSALAADLPSRKGPPPVYLPPPPVFTWTGFYVGVNLGGGWRERNNDNFAFPGLFPNPLFPIFSPTPFITGVFPFAFNNNDNNSGGVVGGGQIGYNFQFSPWLVVGVETDFQGTSIGSGGDNNVFFGSHLARLPWFGTVRGRVGVTPLDPHFLLYGTGGFAYGEVRRNGFLFNDFNRVETGWTAGGGIEWAFLPNWSVKAEYLFTDLSANNDGNFFGDCGFGFGCNRHFKFHTVRAGLNYHFNLFNPAPVVARY